MPDQTLHVHRRTSVIHICTNAYPSPALTGRVYCGCGFMARCHSCGREGGAHFPLSTDPRYKCLFGPRFWEQRTFGNVEVRYA